MTNARILHPEPEVSPSEIVAKHSTELIKFDVTEQQIEIRELLGSVRVVTFESPEASNAFVGATEQLDETAVYLETFGAPEAY
jgi:hypothetical protein